MKQTKTTQTKAQPKKVTLVSLIKKHGAVGVKSRAELAQKVLASAKEIGMSVNVRGFQIKEERVKSLISAFIRDINQNRAGHWQTLTVTENKDGLKILPN